MPLSFLTFGKRSTTSLVIVACFLFTAPAPQIAPPDEEFGSQALVQASLTTEAPNGPSVLSRLSNRARAGVSSRKRVESAFVIPEIALKPQQASDPLRMRALSRILSPRTSAPQGRSPPEFFF